MNLPKRKNIRLKNWSYDCGAYFLTICTKDRKNLLATINVGAAIGGPQQLTLTEIGEKVEQSIQNIENIYNTVSLDKYVIMPNHVHMILIFNNQTQTLEKGNAALSQIVNKFKGHVTKHLKKTIWQKLFFDRVIRNEKEYLLVWKYIDENPLKWVNDKYYSAE